MVGKRKEPQAGALGPISSVEPCLHPRRKHLENRAHAARRRLSALSPAGTVTWVDVPASLAPGRHPQNGSRFGVRPAGEGSELECEQNGTRVAKSLLRTRPGKALIRCSRTSCREEGLC